MWLLALMMGCTPGPNAETVIDELRIVGSVAEPPEVGVDEGTSVSLYIADPLAETPEVWVWTCTRLGPDCAESGMAERTMVPDITDGVATVELQPRPELAELVGAAPISVEVWAVACADGLCDFDGLPSTAFDDPGALVADLPFEGVSLAVKRVLVSGRAPEERVANPTLALVGSTAGTQTEPSWLEFEVDARAPVELWGYATSGGFGMPSVFVEPGSTALEYYPSETSDGELFVVAVQEGGGSAVWRGAAE